MTLTQTLTFVTQHTYNLLLAACGRRNLRLFLRWFLPFSIFKIGFFGDDVVLRSKVCHQSHFGDEK